MDIRTVCRVFQKHGSEQAVAMAPFAICLRNSPAELTSFWGSRILMYYFGMQHKSICWRPAEDSSVLSSGTFGQNSWNLFIMLSRLKKLFSRAKMKEKDKKTEMLKNAALKIIVSVFTFSRFSFMQLFK